MVDLESSWWSAAPPSGYLEAAAVEVGVQVDLQGETESLRPATLNIFLNSFGGHSEENWNLLPSITNTYRFPNNNNKLNINSIPKVTSKFQVDLILF